MNLQVGDQVRLELEVRVFKQWLIFVSSFQDQDVLPVRWHDFGGTTWLQVLSSTQVCNQILKSVINADHLSLVFTSSAHTRVYLLGDSAEGCAINEGRAFCVLHKQVPLSTMITKCTKNTQTTQTVKTLLDSSSFPRPGAIHHWYQWTDGRTGNNNQLCFYFLIFRTLGSCRWATTRVALMMVPQSTLWPSLRTHSFKIRLVRPGRAFKLLSQVKLNDLEFS